MSTNTPAGWYPAPHANNEQRYWDGSAWSDVTPEQASQQTAATAVLDEPTPPKKRGLKWWVWALIAVGVLAVFGGIINAVSGGGDDTDAAPAASEVAEEEEEEPAVEEPVEEEPVVEEEEPAPAPAVERQEYTGTGDMVFDVNITGPAIATFACDNCTSNTVLKTNGRESLLVNTIGAYRGARLVNVNDGSMITQIVVEADGSWTLTIDDVLTAPSYPDAATGAGDSVVLMTGDFSSAAITNDGGSNFVVKAYGSGNWSSLIVNEIGAYSGTREMSGPAVVEVTSTGNWSITPQ